MRHRFHPTFTTLSCSALTDSQLQECSELFSNNYGTYSGKDHHVKGERIKLSPQRYGVLRSMPDMYVSLCYDGSILLGQAFFLNKQLTNGEKCSWVTQLVVHKSYRKRGIGTRLLQSAWGFSNYFAWGLATANALTIKTLESVTWRKVSPSVIHNHLPQIQELCRQIPFVRQVKVSPSEKMSQVFTEFYPTIARYRKNGIFNVCVSKLGALEEGNEWLAFTFQSQPRHFDEKHWNKMLDFSAEQLDDAYSRMSMTSHAWASHASDEVDHIINACRLIGREKIIDVGCGIGRHSLEFARRGFQVVGVDFSERLLTVARESSSKEGFDIPFVCKDARNLSIRGTFDVAICLYDVVGSYRTKKENTSIIESIYKKLRKDGKCVMSVMNMELTESIAIHRGEVRKNPALLFGLPASDMMQRTGNVFNPNFFILDEKQHLVYRKEQFSSDGQLSAEYVIADYRFRCCELCEVLRQTGFRIISATHVQAGHWDIPLPATDMKAKEILVIAEKN